MEYVPDTDSGSGTGSFHLKIMHDQVEFKGNYFRDQRAINQYLINRGIAIKLGLVNLGEINNRSGRGSILLIEEMKYSQEKMGSLALSRAKALLKIPLSVYGHPDRDAQFLGIKNGALIHTRSGDLIPSDQWVPLYRPGSIFGAISEDVPINLEEVEHAIL